MTAATSCVLPLHLQSHSNCTARVYAGTASVISMIGARAPVKGLPLPTGERKQVSASPGARRRSASVLAHGLGQAALALAHRDLTVMVIGLFGHQKARSARTTSPLGPRVPRVPDASSRHHAPPDRVLPIVVYQNKLSPPVRPGRSLRRVLYAMPSVPERQSRTNQVLLGVRGASGIDPPEVPSRVDRIGEVLPGMW